MITPAATKPADPLALLRTRRYLALLVLAAILGVPIAAVAYGFLKLVAVLEQAVYTQLPSGLGFHGEPLWWPLLPLALAGLLVGLTIRYLPGRGGHSPADGFKPRAAITAAEIPGVFLAALATLSLGPVRPFGANAVTAWTWPHCAVGAPAQPRPGRLRLQCRRRAEAEVVRPGG
jgi:hypothetical protein